MSIIIMMENRTELLRKIKDEVVNSKDSPLYEYRIKNKYFPVIGEGSHTAKIMFIGEAPGRNEAETGRPFCGASGRVLDELLASIGIDRKEIYVTNIVKDRPPENRDPLPNEIEFYASFLDRQIEIIKPKTIATLGRFSMAYIMNKFGLESELKSISQIHGKIFNAPAPWGNEAKRSPAPSRDSGSGAWVKIIPLYHPAVAVYGTNKEILKKDFKILVTS